MKNFFMALLITFCVALPLFPATALATGEPAATVADFSQLEAALQNADVSDINVTADIAFTKTLDINRSVTFTADQEATFTLADGFTGRHFSVNASAAEVTVDFGPVIMDGGSSGGGLAVSVSNLVSLTGGTIQNCNAPQGGAMKAAYRNGPQPTLTLSMTQISGNSATSEGGAVYLDSNPGINNAKLVVNDGLISENTASRGGAIYAFFVQEVEMAGGILNQNETTGYGGAIYLVSGTFRISDGEITNNTAKTRGGAIYMAGGQIPQFIYIDGGTFRGNKAEKSGYTISMGGAICMNDKTTFAMTDGTFTGNSASQGGAICQENNSSKPFSITGGQFTDNSADGSLGGGAIRLQQNAQASAATFSGVTFTGNQALHSIGGGGAVSGPGTKTFTGCSFENNTAATGGAISSGSQSLALSDCTFKGNAAENGGAVFAGMLTTDKLTISNSTFSDNTAKGFGGAISASPLAFVETNGVVFENNKSSYAYPNLPVGDIEAAHTAHIVNTTYSAPFTHGFNNYDIGPSANDRDEIAAMGAQHFRVALKAGANGSLANPSAVQSFVAKGSDLTQEALAAAQPTAEPGFAFDCWETEDGVAAVLPLTVTKDIVLTATFAKMPTLTFETNGGSAVAPVTVVAGSKIQLNQETTRSGHKFTGWYEDAALTQKLTEVTLTEDKTVYAGWDPIKKGGGGSSSSVTNYSLTFETNGGSPVNKIIKPAGTKITLDQTTTRPGYIFTGWYSNQALSQRITTVTLKQNTTVYAGWEQVLLNKDPKLGYINGTELGLFLPDENMTRAEAAAMFYQLLLDQKAGGNITFDDIQGDEWFATPMLVLASKGILKGDDGSARPNDNITRAEFAVIAARLISAENNGSSKGFTDVGKGHWAAEEISRISALGYINGYPDGTFRPNQNITRAEAVKITNRLLGRIPDKADMEAGSPEAKSFPDVPQTHWAYYEIYVAVNGMPQ